MPAFITRGAIVLLPKKADQMLLANKRPITLLNTCYKIGAKAFQSRLSPILQRIISYQQSAFLPGRNIHHSLLLIGEMLQQAHESGEEHILLKLDISKAFDRLEWEFILAVVDRTGLTGLLTKFLRSGFRTASSHIILNGRPTGAFRLARSVRQGCPLSPLVFILAFDSITHVFAYAMERRAIVGVQFPKLRRSNLLSMFADDFVLITRANMGYIMEIKRILGVFGAASGLICVWEQTKAAFIPSGPPPPAFWLLPWAWEVEIQATPLLGYPIASQFSSLKMEEMVQSKITMSITKHRYLLTLWAGELTFLAKIQKQLDSFVWAGKSRVNKATVTQGKAGGGIGLLSVEDQYRSIAGNLMIWILGPDKHLLRKILCTHIQELSVHKWGFTDLTWMVTPGGGTVSGGSAPWQNICCAWAKLKPLLAPSRPHNVLEWTQLPLWRPHYNHRIQQRVKCSTGAQHMLRQAGLLYMGDVISPTGNFLEWHELPPCVVATRKERVYRALIDNLQPNPITEAPTGQHHIFFAETQVEPSQRIWQFTIANQDASAPWDQIYPRYTPIKMLTAQVGILTTSSISPPPQLTKPHQVILRQPWGKGTAGYSFGPWTPDRAFLCQYKWRDETALLNTSMAQLRSLQAQQRHVPHLALGKWERQLGCNMSQTAWSATWLDYRSATENTFMWQLLYRVIAMQHWRFPGQPMTDSSTWCTRCSNETEEDVTHCIWECPLSQQCWRWGEFILRKAAGDTHDQITLQPAHVFMAHPLPDHWHYPERLWHLLKAILCWQIWKNRNEHYLAAQPANSLRVIRKSWARLGTYLRKEWRFLGRKVDLGKLTALEAEHLMYSRFGACPDIWNLHGITLQVPPVPPRPP